MSEPVGVERAAAAMAAVTAGYKGDPEPLEFIRKLVLEGVPTLLKLLFDGRRLMEGVLPLLEESKATIDELTAELARRRASP